MGAAGSAHCRTAASPVNESRRPAAPRLLHARRPSRPTRSTRTSTRLENNGVNESIAARRPPREDDARGQRLLKQLCSERTAAPFAAVNAPFTASLAPVVKPRWVCDFTMALAQTWGEQ